ncbi:hypothetical protein D918_03431 [Trichuris suis]|nr:hypothetical protein D918_03431 [Trichuris suis]
MEKTKGKEVTHDSRKGKYVQWSQKRRMAKYGADSSRKRRPGKYGADSRQVETPKDERGRLCGVTFLKKQPISAIAVITMEKTMR